MSCEDDISTYVLVCQGGRKGRPRIWNHEYTNGRGGGALTTLLLPLPFHFATLSVRTGSSPVTGEEGAALVGGFRSSLPLR